MNKYLQESVNRFLGWKLPTDFSPDAGISFTREANAHMPPEYMYLHSPVGTNLFSADQAKDMLTHVAKPLLDRIIELETQLAEVQPLQPITAEMLDIDEWTNVWIDCSDPNQDEIEMSLFAEKIQLAFCEKNGIKHKGDTK